MAGYIRFSVSARDIGTTMGVRSRTIYDFPDGVLLYYAGLFNDLDIIMLAWPAERYKDGYKHKISIFDKEITLYYRSSMALLFSVFELNKTSCVFSVETVNGKTRKKIGSLKMVKDGSIVYNQEVISDAKARRRYIKKLVVDGG